MPLFGRHRPSLMHNIKEGAKLGVFSVVVFAFFLWWTGFQYSEVEEEIFNQQFQKIVDSLDDRKYYTALVQLWNLGMLICHPYFLLLGMVVGILLGIKRYTVQKEHERLQRERELQILRKNGGTSRSSLIIFFTTIFGAISSGVYFIWKKIKNKQKKN